MGSLRRHAFEWIYLEEFIWGGHSFAGIDLHGFICMVFFVWMPLNAFIWGNLVGGIYLKGFL